MSQSTVSGHLKRLLDISIIEARQVETSMVYSIEKGVGETYKVLSDLLD